MPSDEFDACADSEGCDQTARSQPEGKDHDGTVLMSRSTVSETVQVLRTGAIY